MTAILFSSSKATLIDGMRLGITFYNGIYLAEHLNVWLEVTHSFSNIMNMLFLYFMAIHFV